MRRALLAVALLAGAAHADCDCRGNFSSLKAERTALPAVYDVIFGLVPPHTREYWQRRLTTLPDRATWDAAAFEAAARAQSGLLRDDLAVELLRERVRRFGPSAVASTALARTLARRHRYAEADHAMSEIAAAEMDSHRLWLQLAIRSGPALIARQPATLKIGLLGLDLTTPLGPGFRETPAVVENPATDRQLLELALWQRLGLPPKPFESLLTVFDLNTRDEPEPYFALADLLAATDYRRLAWHAYQRAWDLEHPLSDDIPSYQNQVALGLPETERYDLTTARHYALRRQAMDWVRGWQAAERAVLAAGGNPDDAGAMAKYYEEHPRP